MPPTSHKRPRSTAVRIVRGVGATLGTLVVFVLSLVAGVLLHVGTPPVRRSVVRHVNAILAPSFQGGVRIDRLGGLGLWGLSGVDVTVSDPTGRPVVVARGVRVTFASWTAIRSVLFDKVGPVEVKLYGVSIDTVDVRLDTDAEGNLELIDAFASPTPTSPPTPPTPPGPKGRGVRLDISGISLKHGWAHGQIAGAPALDVDLDGVVAALTVAPDVLEADVAKATVAGRKIANGADVDGALQAHLRLPFAPDAELDARGAWRGTVGGIAHSIDASMSHGKIDAVIDVPRAGPNEIRAVWPASTFDEPATAHVEAHGTLLDLNVVLHAGLGRASLELTGHAVVADQKSAKISFVAHDIDAHEMAPSSPQSRLALEGDVTADLSQNGALEGLANLRFKGGAFGASSLPPASIRVSGSRSAKKSIQADLDAVVDEPGAPTQISAHLTPQNLVTFALDSTSADLYAVPELRRIVHGSVKLAAKGTVDVTDMTIEAEARAQIARVVQGTTRVEGAAVDVTAHGALPEPHLDAVLQVDGIVAGGLRFVTARVHADGPPLAPHLDVYARGPDTPDIDASVDLRLKGGISLGDVRLVLARAGEKALVTAGRVSIDGGDMHVDDARVGGLGADVTAVVAATAGALRVRASTQGVDLARFARLANVQRRIQSGTLAFDVDCNVERATASGRVALSLSDAKIQSFNGVSARVDASLDGRKVSAKVHAEASGVATLDLDAPDVRIGSEGALAARSWRAAWGSVAIDAEANLAKLSKLIPPDQSPVNEASGTVSIHGHVERDDVHDYTPDVSLDVTTRNLAVTPKTARQRHHDEVLVMDPAPWSIGGIDFQVHAAVDGKSGAMKFGAVAHDTKGEIAELRVDSAHIPYEDVFNATGRLVEDLRGTTFDVHFSAPERDLAGLPAILQQTYVTGTLKADVTAKGTMTAPTVDVAASLVKGKGQWLKSPISLDVAAHYDGTRGTASVKAASRGRGLLDGEATFEAAMAQILTAGGDSPWTASAKAHLDSFPIQSLTVLNDKLVKGLVSGDVSIDDLHRDARAKADIAIASLAVGTVAYKGAKIQASADGKTLDASARIEQTDGFLETKAHASATWGAAIAPTLDPAHPLNATLSSKNFRLVALQPFLDGVFDELDGRLDSQASVELDPSERGAKLSGNIALSRGTVEAVAGGGEFHDITGNVKFAPDGTITLQKLTGFGLTGRFDATGIAHVSGSTLQSAKIFLNIPHNAAIPLTAGGSEIGNVDGRVELSATGGANGAMKLAIGVPQFRVALPEGSTTNAEALGPMAKVSIGSHRGAPMTFVVVPIDPAAPVVKKRDAGADAGELDIQVNLGNVQVIRGQELKVGLTGKLAVKAGDATVVSGQIHLIPGGTLTEQGKTFSIENGTVTFVGDDPSNPEIVVQAAWTAPDGTVVFANFVGPLKTGKVTLRSEPALPRDEIVQLLLFGAADGQSAQTPSAGGAGNTTGNAEIGTAAAAGGEAAAPLNHALGQIGLGAVTTKIDTSQTNPKPEVEVQIANDVSLQIAVVLGVPPPGVNPDHTLFTLDWRFMTKWSLASTVGDAGTTIFDVLWKKRY